jgi:hypothetical protein
MLKSAHSEPVTGQLGLSRCQALIFGIQAWSWRLLFRSSWIHQGAIDVQEMDIIGLYKGSAR